jgi:hypothetical protein
MAARPATPAPRISTLAGGTFVIIVIIIIIIIIINK